MRLCALAAAAAFAAAAPALAQISQAPDQGEGPPGWPQPQPICSAELYSYCPDPGLKLGLCLRKYLDMSPGCRADVEASRDQKGKSLTYPPR